MVALGWVMIAVFALMPFVVGVVFARCIGVPLWEAVLAMLSLYVIMSLVGVWIVIGVALAFPGAG